MNVDNFDNNGIMYESDVDDIAMHEEDAIVGFKDRARYTQLDRRGQGSLDSGQLREQDILCSSLLQEDENADILALMCMYLNDMAQEEDIEDDDSAVRIHSFDGRNSTWSHAGGDIDDGIRLSDDCTMSLAEDSDKIAVGYISKEFEACSYLRDFASPMEYVKEFLSAEGIASKTKIPVHPHSSQQPLEQHGDASDEDDDEEHLDYEDYLMLFSLMLNCTLDEVDSLSGKLLDLTAIRRSQWDRVQLSTQSPKKHRTIDSFTESECRNYLRFTKDDVRRLYDKFFGDLPTSYVTIKNFKYTYEEIMLIALHYNANAEKYSSMVNFFGGNWCHYTYPINFFSSFIFNKYYHRICGRSLRYWVGLGDVKKYRDCIWKMACFNCDGEQDINIPREAQRIFSFIDTMPHSFCAVGQGPINRDDERRRMRFLLQRAFYTKYGKKWGMKTQALLLPNGMIGNAWCCSIAHNDKGAINLSGLQEEMKIALSDELLGATNEFPAMFGDNIYRPSEVLVKRNHLEGIFWERMTSMRTDIEHIFGLVSSLWKRLSKKHIWKLLRMRFGATKHILTLFFLTNCYTCLHGNKTSKKFDFPNPDLDSYLDVGEEDAWDGVDEDGPAEAFMAFMEV